MFERGMILRVAIGSDSSYETRAANNALEELRTRKVIRDSLLKPVEVEPAKLPVYSSEGIRAEAIRQAEKALELEEGMHCGLGLEGGIVRLGGESVYMTCVAVARHHGVSEWSYSNPLRIPSWIMTQYENSQTKKRIGEFLSITNLRKDGNVHRYLTGDLASYRATLFTPMLLALGAHFPPHVNTEDQKVAAE